MAENSINSFLDLSSSPEYDTSEAGLTPAEMNEFLAIPEADTGPRRQERTNYVHSAVDPQLINNLLQISGANSQLLYQGQEIVDDDIQDTEAGRNGNSNALEQASGTVDIRAVEEEIRRILASRAESAHNKFSSSSRGVQHTAEPTDHAESGNPRSLDIQHQGLYQNEMGSSSAMASVIGNNESGNRSAEWISTSERNADGNLRGVIAPHETSNIESARPWARPLNPQEGAGLSRQGQSFTNFPATLNVQREVRNDASIIDGTTYDIARFSTYLTQRRLSGVSYEEICKEIDVPVLPLLHEEMDSNSQRDETELTKIPWLVTETNSPTVGRISKDVKYVEQMSVILAEDLFNHLFQLSRNSFLQREEGVHLELWMNFMKKSDVLETMELENQAKEVIKWMETKFVAANLPVMVQNLVKSIEDSEALGYTMQKAKELYNQDEIEMTPLGSLFSLMARHRDVLESNKLLSRRKKELDETVKDIKTFLEQRGLQIPKGKYGKKPKRDAKTVLARENGMISTYAGTRWLIVGCGDAHYAYQCAVLKAAKEAEASIKGRQTKNVQRLMQELNSLGTVMSIHDANGEILPGDLVARRVELINQIDAENVQRIPGGESTILNLVANAMNSLGKIRVRELLETIGGSLPFCFAKVLAATESKIERLRGVGSLEGMVMSDIVAIRDIVEKEMLKNERAKELLRRKGEHVQECQRLFNAVLNANANETGLL